MAAQTTNISSDLVWQLTRMLHPFFFIFLYAKPYTRQYLKIEKKTNLIDCRHFTLHATIFFFFFFLFSPDILKSLGSG